jgi:hypothetical protein
MGRVIGIILILAGLAGIAWGGFTYMREKHDVDLGPVDIQVTEKKRVPIPPAAGAAVVAAGLVLILLDRRRAAAV